VSATHARAAWMLVPPSPERHDGIRDFARLLSASLAPAQQVRLFTTRDDAAPQGLTVVSGWGSLAPSADAAPPSVIYVNYLPTAWLRPDTIALLGALRHWRNAGARVVIIAHEYQLDPGRGMKRTAARVLFRQMARALARRADVFVTTHGFVAGLARVDGIHRLCRVVTIPVGSNVGGSTSGAPGRRQIAVFGQAAGMDPTMMAAGVREAQAARCAMVWICRDGRAARDWMDRHGFDRASIAILEGLSAAAASEELLASAAGFAPIVDGVSTRRGTVAAMLQHGLPVAGSDGRATDPLFRDSPAFALAPVGDGAAMAACVRHVLETGERRDNMARAARFLFDEHLAWPRIAARYLELTA
jgi:hypothetical protein